MPLLDFFTAIPSKLGLGGTKQLATDETDYQAEEERRKQEEEQARLLAEAQEAYRGEQARLGEEQERQQGMLEQARSRFDALKGQAGEAFSGLGSAVRDVQGGLTSTAERIGGVDVDWKASSATPSGPGRNLVGEAAEALGSAVAESDYGKWRTETQRKGAEDEATRLREQQEAFRRENPEAPEPQGPLAGTSGGVALQRGARGLQDTENLVGPRGALREGGPVEEYLTPDLPGALPGQEGARDLLVKTGLNIGRGLFGGVQGVQQMEKELRAAETGRTGERRDQGTGAWEATPGEAPKELSPLERAQMAGGAAVHGAMGGIGILSAFNPRAAVSAALATEGAKQAGVPDDYAQAFGDLVSIFTHGGAGEQYAKVLGPDHWFARLLSKTGAIKPEDLRDAATLAMRQRQALAALQIGGAAAGAAGGIQQGREQGKSPWETAALALSGAISGSEVAGGFGEGAVAPNRAARQREARANAQTALERALESGAPIPPHLSDAFGGQEPTPLPSAQRDPWSTEARFAEAGRDTVDPRTGERIPAPTPAQPEPPLGETGEALEEFNAGQYRTPFVVEQPRGVTARAEPLERTPMTPEEAQAAIKAANAEKGQWAQTLGRAGVKSLNPNKEPAGLTPELQDVWARYVAATQRVADLQAQARGTTDAKAAELTPEQRAQVGQPPANLPRLGRGGWENMEASASGGQKMVGAEPEGPPAWTDLLKGAKEVQDAPFFSQLSRALAGLQPEASAAQVRATLQKAGVKADELRWSGVEDYLAAKEADGVPVTRAELEAWTAKNQPRVYEIAKGEQPATPPEEIARLQAYLDQAQAAYDRVQDETLRAQEINKRAMTQVVGDALVANARSRGEAVDNAQEAFLRQMAEGIAANRITGAGPARQWQEAVQPFLTEAQQQKVDAIVRGIGDHRLRLRTADQNLRQASRFLTDAQGRDPLPGGFAKWKTYRGVTLPGADLDEANYKEYLFVLPGREHGWPGQRMPNFQSGHWEARNVIAHVRVSDRLTPDGKRVLFVEELQSDWHQKAREKVRVPGTRRGEPGSRAPRGYYTGERPTDETVKATPAFATQADLLAKRTAARADYERLDQEEIGLRLEGSRLVRETANRLARQALSEASRHLQPLAQTFSVTRGATPTADQPLLWVVYKKYLGVGNAVPVQIHEDGVEAADQATRLRTYREERALRTGRGDDAIDLDADYGVVPRPPEAQTGDDFVYGSALLGEWATAEARNDPAVREWNDRIARLQMAKGDAESDAQMAYTELSRLLRSDPQSAVVLWNDEANRLYAVKEEARERSSAARQALADFEARWQTEVEAGRMSDDPTRNDDAFLQEHQDLGMAEAEADKAYRDADANYDEAAQRADDAEKFLGLKPSEIPPAGPYSGSGWRELVAKRLLQLSAQGDYDYLGWTPGEPQGWRYSTEGQFNSLERDVNTGEIYTIDASGHRRGGWRPSEDELDHYFGEDITDALLDKGRAGPTGRVFLSKEEVDRMNPDAKRKAGMAGFYDEVLPNLVSELTGGLGRARPGEILLDPTKPPDATMQEQGEAYDRNRDVKNAYPVHLVPLTPEVKAVAGQQRPLFIEEGQAPGQAPTRGVVDVTPPEGPPMDGAAGAAGAIALPRQGLLGNLPSGRDVDTLAGAAGALTGALQEEGEIEEEERQGRSVDLGERLRRIAGRSALYGAGGYGISKGARKAGGPGGLIDLTGLRDGARPARGPGSRAVERLDPLAGPVVSEATAFGQPERSGRPNPVTPGERFRQQQGVAQATGGFEPDSPEGLVTEALDQRAAEATEAGAGIDAVREAERAYAADPTSPEARGKLDEAAAAYYPSPEELEVLPGAPAASHQFGGARDVATLLRMMDAGKEGTHWYEVMSGVLRRHSTPAGGAATVRSDIWREVVALFGRTGQRTTPEVNHELALGAVLARDDLMKAGKWPLSRDEAGVATLRAAMRPYMYLTSGEVKGEVDPDAVRAEVEARKARQAARGAQDDPATAPLEEGEDADTAEISEMGKDGDPNVATTGNALKALIDMWNTGETEIAGNLKLSSYTTVLIDPTTGRVTMFSVPDVWMFTAFGYENTDSASSDKEASRYVMGVIKRLADERGLTPAQVQAAIWTGARKLAETDPALMAETQLRYETAARAKQVEKATGKRAEAREGLAAGRQYQRAFEPQMRAEERRAYRELERQRQPARQTRALAQRDVDDAQAAYDQAKAALQEAQAAKDKAAVAGHRETVATAKTALAEARAALKEVTASSPIRDAERAYTERRQTLLKAMGGVKLRKGLGDDRVPGGPPGPAARAGVAAGKTAQALKTAETRPIERRPPASIDQTAKRLRLNGYGDEIPDLDTPEGLAQFQGSIGNPASIERVNEALIAHFRERAPDLTPGPDPTGEGPGVLDVAHRNPKLQGPLGPLPYSQSRKEAAVAAERAEGQAQRVNVASPYHVGSDVTEATGLRPPAELTPDQQRQFTHRWLTTVWGYDPATKSLANLPGIRHVVYPDQMGSWDNGDGTAGVEHNARILFPTATAEQARTLAALFGASAGQNGAGLYRQRPDAVFEEALARKDEPGAPIDNVAVIAHPDGQPWSRAEIERVFGQVLPGMEVGPRGQLFVANYHSPDYPGMTPRDFRLHVNGLLKGAGWSGPEVDNRVTYEDADLEFIGAPDYGRHIAAAESLRGDDGRGAGPLGTGPAYPAAPTLSPTGGVPGVLRAHLEFLRSEGWDVPADAYDRLVALYSGEPGPAGDGADLGARADALDRGAYEPAEGLTARAETGPLYYRPLLPPVSANKANASADRAFAAGVPTGDGLVLVDLAGHDPAIVQQLATGPTAPVRDGFMRTVATAFADVQAEMARIAREAGLEIRTPQGRVAGQLPPSAEASATVLDAVLKGSFLTGDRVGGVNAEKGAGQPNEVYVDLHAGYNLASWKLKQLALRHGARFTEADVGREFAQQLYGTLIHEVVHQHLAQHGGRFDAYVNAYTAAIEAGGKGPQILQALQDAVTGESNDHAVLGALREEARLLASDPHAGPWEPGRPAGADARRARIERDRGAAARGPAPGPGLGRGVVPRRDRPRGRAQQLPDRGDESAGPRPGGDPGDLDGRAGPGGRPGGDVLGGPGRRAARGPAVARLLGSGADGRDGVDGLATRARGIGRDDALARGTYLAASGAGGSGAAGSAAGGAGAASAGGSGSAGAGASGAAGGVTKEPTWNETLQNGLKLLVLFSPRGLARQAMGNAASMVWQPWERGVASRIARVTGRKGADVPITGEGWAQIRGWMEHAGEGWQEARAAAAGKQTPGQQAMAQAMGVPAQGTYGGKGLKGAINAATERGYGIVGMFDVLARKLATEGEARAQGYREAKRTGGSETAIRDRAEQALVRELGAHKGDMDAALQALSDEDRHIAERSQAAASYRTLTQDLDKFGQWVEDGRNLPGGVGRYVIPFWKVPYNGMKYDLERSPAGLLGVAAQTVTGKGKAKDATEHYERWARGLTGTLMSTLLLKAVLDGNATGPEPTDDAEKRQWQASGKTPYSLLLGGRWVPMAQFPGVNATLVQMGQIGDFIRRRNISGWDDDDYQRLVNRAVTGTISAIATRPFFDQLNNILTNLGESDEERGLGGAALDVATGFAVPAVVRDLERATDNTNRAPRNIGERLQANVPGLSRNVPARRDVYGRESRRTGSGLERMLSPILGSQATDREPYDRFFNSTGPEMDTAIAEAKRVVDRYADDPYNARVPTPRERALAAYQPSSFEQALRSRERGRLKGERAAAGPAGLVITSGPSRR